MGQFQSPAHFYFRVTSQPLALRTFNPSFDAVYTFGYDGYFYYDICYRSHIFILRVIFQPPHILILTRTVII